MWSIKTWEGRQYVDLLNCADVREIRYLINEEDKKIDRSLKIIKFLELIIYVMEHGQLPPDDDIQ